MTQRAVAIQRSNGETALRPGGPIASKRYRVRYMTDRIGQSPLPRARAAPAYVDAHARPRDGSPPDVACPSPPSS
jgi:hypothetical protein